MYFEVCNFTVQNITWNDDNDTANQLIPFYYGTEYLLPSFLLNCTHISLKPIFSPQICQTFQYYCIILSVGKVVSLPSAFQQKLYMHLSLSGCMLYIIITLCFQICHFGKKLCIYSKYNSIYSSVTSVDVSPNIILRLINQFNPLHIYTSSYYIHFNIILIPEPRFL